MAHAVLLPLFAPKTRDPSVARGTANANANAMQDTVDRERDIHIHRNRFLVQQQ